MRQSDTKHPRLNFNNCFFRIFRGKDEVTIDEVYAICHKSPDDKRFIRNKLAIWRKLGLAEPIYKDTSANGKFELLAGVRLTALGQSYFHRVVHQASKMLTASELLNIVAAFKKQHPDIIVTFELRWVSTSPNLEAS